MDLRKDKQTQAIGENNLINVSLVVNFFTFYRLVLVEILSKTRKKVPVLLLPHWKAAVTEILRVRELYTLQTNDYVFAMPNSNKSYMGWTALNAITKNLDLSDRAAITSTQIRKYVASSSQVHTKLCFIFYMLKNITNYV